MKIETDIDGIEAACHLYANARMALADHVTTMERDIAAVRKAGMPKLKELVAAAAKNEAQLKALVEANEPLFAKPRTRSFHNIKVGFVKAKGKLNLILEPDVVVRLIRKHFGKNRAKTLIKVTETPVKTALAELSAAELKKIGCSVEDTGDVAVVKPIDGEIDKIVDALIALGTEPESGGKKPKRGKK